MTDIEPLLTALCAYNRHHMFHDRLTLIIESDGTGRFLTHEQDVDAHLPRVAGSHFNQLGNAFAWLRARDTSCAQPENPLSQPVQMSVLFTPGELIAIIGQEDEWPSSSD